MSVEKIMGGGKTTDSYYDGAIANGPHCATLDVGRSACHAILLCSGNGAWAVLVYLPRTALGYFSGLFQFYCVKNLIVNVELV
jgi:hypothetical protein